MTQQKNRRRGGERLAPPQKGGGRRAAPAQTEPNPPVPDEPTKIWKPGEPIQVSPAHFWDEEGDPVREAPPMANTKQKKKRRWPLVLGAVAVLLVALFVRYRQWAQAPELPGQRPVAPGVSQEGEEDQAEAPDATAGNRKDGFYTFLLIGRDTGGGGNTDTLMLAAYDTKNQQAGLMSIPRDTMVDVSWDVKKINTVYNMYLGRGEEEAVGALEDAVAGLVGFRPDYTVTVEWQAVGDIVEAIGGVYFEVPFYMSYVDPTQDLYIDQPPGYRLLSGTDAMQVVRWRKNNTNIALPAGADGSDLGRAKIQQDFIMATLKQCLQIQNIPKIWEIAQVFTDRVTTELTAGNLMWFAEKALLGGFSAEELYTCTMPCAGASVYSSTYNTNLSYVVPQPEELLAEINGHFNPFEVEVTMDNLDLMRPDGNGAAYPSGGTPLGS